MDKKREIRDDYRQRREEMGRGQVETLSLKICANLIENDLFSRSEYLYAYAPLGSEADVREVAAAAWRENKRVAFPKVFGKEMRYFEITDFSRLKRGAYGIMEPEESAGAFPVDWRSEPGLLVLVPGIAFDREGARLGYGKGYYDRHFANRTYPAADRACPGPVLAGVAYAFQIADSLPAEAHDLRVSRLVTEQGVLAADGHLSQ